MIAIEFSDRKVSTKAFYVLVQNVKVRQKKKVKVLRKYFIAKRTIRRWKRFVRIQKLRRIFECLRDAAGKHRRLSNLVTKVNHSILRKWFLCFKLACKQIQLRDQEKIILFKEGMSVDLRLKYFAKLKLFLRVRQDVNLINKMPH